MSVKLDTGLKIKFGNETKYLKILLCKYAILDMVRKGQY